VRSAKSETLVGCRGTYCQLLVGSITCCSMLDVLMMRRFFCNYLHALWILPISGSCWEIFSHFGSYVLTFPNRAFLQGSDHFGICHIDIFLRIHYKNYKTHLYWLIMVFILSFGPFTFYCSYMYLLYLI
jgi:hypothetical protein